MFTGAAAIFSIKQRSVISRILEDTSRQMQIDISASRKQLTEALILQSGKLPYPMKLIFLLLFAGANSDRVFKIWTQQADAPNLFLSLFLKPHFILLDYYLFLSALAVGEYECR